MLGNKEFIRLRIVNTRRQIDNCMVATLKSEAPMAEVEVTYVFLKKGVISQLKPDTSFSDSE